MAKVAKKAAKSAAKTRVKNSESPPAKLAPVKPYVRFPDVQGEKVVFVYDDDVWSVPLSGGTATRLTARNTVTRWPKLSHDGSQLAFVGIDEGSGEIYTMPSTGGSAKRLTYSASEYVAVCGWSKDDQSLLITSGKGGLKFSDVALFKVAASGSQPEALNLGPASDCVYGPRGQSLIARYSSRAPRREAAHWKRYRGGTAGAFWIDRDGRGEYRRFLHQLNGNLDCPMWIGEKIYFVSDHEGVGNLYSVSPTGTGLKRLTHFDRYFIRHASSDGTHIVFVAGGDLFRLDLKTNEILEIRVTCSTSTTHLSRKFVSATEWMHSSSLDPKGKNLLITVRGKTLAMPLHHGPALQFGMRQGVRYQSAIWLKDSERFVVVSDVSGEERLEVYSGKTGILEKSLKADIGLLRGMEVSPTRDELVIANHRGELLHVDLQKEKVQVLDKTPFLYGVKGFDISPDGNTVAYAINTQAMASVIRLVDLKTKKIRTITQGAFMDASPSFDRDGKYLYFLSHRKFDPVYDSSFFQLSFPGGFQPFLVTLQKDSPNPFMLSQKSEEKPKTEKGDKKKGNDAKSVSCVIDFEGIENRVLSFEGLARASTNYVKVVGAQGGVFLLSTESEGALAYNWSQQAEPKGSLEVFSFADLKTEHVDGRWHSVEVSADGQHLSLIGANKLRVLAAKSVIDGKGKLSSESEAGPVSGWVNLARAEVEIDPRSEWKQIAHEVWRHQREYFWDEKMVGIDWPSVYVKYEPLLARVATRTELSDVIWEMIGELGTSHAYEFGGDYRGTSRYRQGALGADCKWNAKDSAYDIVQLVAGDSWVHESTSPLLAPGVLCAEGDQLVSVNRRALTAQFGPDEALVNCADKEVLLGVRRKKSESLLPKEKKKKGSGKIDATEYIVVKTLASEHQARYRQWVERNKAYVRQKSKGRVGYLHVPDMGPAGYSEFHRHYVEESEKDALIVDVRFNGGGHVSQLLLEELNRKVIGYNVSRWNTPDGYPAHAPRGPLVALTNELAGSDGDIFSHSFKLMKLGTLVGTRTWGGVVGIWPQHRHVDGTMTTQPQFAYWFKDVGWQVENYGTDPDVEVHRTPQEYKKGIDSQLDEGLALVLKQLSKKAPSLPSFVKRPNLALRPLPRPVSKRR